MHQTPDIADCIEKNLALYFHNLNGESTCNVYEMVLLQVEKPLLRFVLNECGGNQSRAAQILGLNRNTLRKKLALHELLES